MRARGELREDIPHRRNPLWLASLFEGMLRDQVIAKRMGFPATYDSSEVKKVFKVVLVDLPGLADEVS